MADDGGMKLRLIIAAIICAGAATACGGGKQAVTTPNPTGFQSGILAPAQKAQDTVNQLNQHENGLDQQTGTTYP